MAWSAGAGIEGTVVVVTGAARGIGRSVAEAFGAAGAHVVAVDVLQIAHDTGFQHQEPVKSSTSSSTSVVVVIAVVAASLLLVAGLVWVKRRSDA